MPVIYQTTPTALSNNAVTQAQCDSNGRALVGGDLVRVRSDKDTHFSTELATNAIEAENLTWPTANVSATGIVREIRIWSDQNLAWEVQFWRDDDGAETDADLDGYLGAHQFATADGVQNAGSGLYRYVAVGLDLAYEDTDDSTEVHLILVNRSATTKTAGASGEVVVEVLFEVR